MYLLRANCFRVDVSSMVVWMSMIVLALIQGSHQSQTGRTSHVPVDPDKTALDFRPEGMVGGVHGNSADKKSARRHFAYNGDYYMNELGHGGGIYLNELGYNAGHYMNELLEHSIPYHLPHLRGIIKRESPWSMFRGKFMPLKPRTMMSSHSYGYGGRSNDDQAKYMSVRRALAHDRAVRKNYETDDEDRLQNTRRSASTGKNSERTGEEIKYCALKVFRDTKEACNAMDRINTILTLLDERYWMIKTAEKDGIVDPQNSMVEDANLITIFEQFAKILKATNEKIDKSIKERRKDKKSHLGKKNSKSKKKHKPNFRTYIDDQFEQQEVEPEKRMFHEDFDVKLAADRDSSLPDNRFHNSKEKKSKKKSKKTKSSKADAISLRKANKSNNETSTIDSNVDVLSNISSNVHNTTTDSNTIQSLANTTTNVTNASGKMKDQEPIENRIYYPYSYDTENPINSTSIDETTTPNGTLSSLGIRTPFEGNDNSTVVNNVTLTESESLKID